MSKKKLASLKLYLTAITLIAGWWLYAFTSPQKNATHISEIPFPHPEIASAPPLIKYLSHLKRDSLQMALSGDFSLMTKLISEWDVDAQILQSHGVSGVKRIPRQDFLKSQLLYRQLRNSKNEVQNLNEVYRAQIVIDDKKQAFSLKKAYSCFLPQTYVSASFLLALTEPETIAGIPQGLRTQTALFSPELTKRIPLDVDRFNSEKLFYVKPQLAFVSFYSHPSTLNALSAQGIDLFHVDEINSLPEILNALDRIGHVIDKPLQSELLKIFITAAMTTIDNRFQALGFNHQEEKSPHILLLNYHTTYSTPAKRTIIAQLLQRIGISSYTDDETCWSHPLDQEQIVQLNPDCLIFATSHPAELHRHLMQNPALVELDAIKNRRFYYVDDKVQNFPSQYIVLAYYDLLIALSDANPFGYLYGQ